MTSTTTEIDELRKTKDVVWDALLKSAYDSKEGKRLEQQYVEVCRKIRRLENP